MPNRVIREGILTSEPVNSLSWAAECFFMRLMLKADDFGRFDARESILRASLYPLKISQVREADITRWTAECQKAGLIALYEIEGKRYLEIPKFDQRLRAKTSKWPTPDSHMSVTSQSSALGGGGGGGGENRESKAELRYPAGAGDEFQKLFGRWIAFRKGIGRKPKDWDALFQEQLDWFGKQPKGDWSEIISQSIRNGWQGLFDLKRQRNGARSDNPKPLDPSKIELPERFKSWAGEKYHPRKDEIMAWKTWAEVPASLRQEWWREEKAKLPISV